eukprot:5627422-Prymnesium_polylepis.1
MPPPSQRNERRTFVPSMPSEPVCAWVCPSRGLTPQLGASHPVCGHSLVPPDKDRDDAQTYSRCCWRHER